MPPSPSPSVSSACHRVLHTPELLHRILSVSDIDSHEAYKAKPTHKALCLVEHAILPLTFSVLYRSLTKTEAQGRLKDTDRVRRLLRHSVQEIRNFDSETLLHRQHQLRALHLAYPNCLTFRPHLQCYRYCDTTCSWEQKMTFTTGPDAARPERISTRLLSLEFQARIWTQDAYTDGADRLGVANTPASKTYQLIDQRHATVVYVPSQRKIATRNEGLAEDHLAAFEARLQDLGLPSVIECHSIPPADVQDFRWTLKPDMWTADTGLTAVHFASYPHPTPQSLAIVASSAYGRLHSLRGLYLTPTELVDVSSVIQDLFPSLEVMEFSLTIDDSDCPVPPNLEPIFPLTKSSLREVSVSMHSRKTPSVLNATILLATIGGRQTNFKYIDSGFDHHFEEINDMVHYLKYLSVAQQKSLLHSSWAELDFDQDQESFCADNAEDEDEDGLSSLDKWYPWMRTSLLGLEWHEDGEPIPLCESAALRHLYDANNDKTYREQSTKIRESIQAEITESASLLEKRGWTVRPYEWSTGRQLAMKSSEIGVLDKKITEAQAKLDELEAAILVAQARLGE